MKKYKYLQNRKFLNDFYNQKNKEQFIRINCLDFETEKTLSSIDGKATGGDITIDATSACRRSASLNMVIINKDKTLVELDNDLAINKKVSLEILYTNTLKEKYPEYANYDYFIFPQGYYVINSVNLSRGANGLTASVNLLDKMALLTGDCGGIISNDVVFSNYYDGYFDSSIKAVTKIKKLKFQDVFSAMEDIIDNLGTDQEVQKRTDFNNVLNGWKFGVRDTLGLERYSKIENIANSFTGNGQEGVVKLFIEHEASWKDDENIESTIREKYITLWNDFYENAEKNLKDEYVTEFVDVKVYPTMHQIIKELVNHFGKEQLGKIIIDLDEGVKQVLRWEYEDGYSEKDFKNVYIEYIGRTSLAINKIIPLSQVKVADQYYEIHKSVVEDNSIQSAQMRKKFNDILNGWHARIKNNLNEKIYKIIESTIEIYKQEIILICGSYDWSEYGKNKNIEAVVKLNEAWTSFMSKMKEMLKDIVVENKSEYQLTTENPGINMIAEIPCGGDIGMSWTPFIYPQEPTTELKCEAGDSVVSVLNKIKDILGNYEFFYDVEGNFIFREIKNYLNTNFNSSNLKALSYDDYLVNVSAGKSVYSFDNDNLITAYTRDPQYSEIKNDFMVIGERKSGDISIPVYYHLAIDEKPFCDGKTSYNYIYAEYNIEDKEGNMVKNNMCKVPVSYKSLNMFPIPGLEFIIYHSEADNSYWYWNPTLQKYEQFENGKLKIESVVPDDWRTVLFFQGAAAAQYGTDSNYYYPELLAHWPEEYDFTKSPGEYKNTPTTMNYFLDIIDNDSAVSKFSVKSIGRRSKVLNKQNGVNCVFEFEVPEFFFLNNNIDNRIEQEVNLDEYNLTIQNGYKWIGVNNISDKIKLMTGGVLKSAFEECRNLLYQHTKYNDSVALTTIPIYHLEPNSRISITDSDIGIFGDYMINSISIPFDVNGTSTINCSKVIEKI